jgi:hypothetical protein
MAEPQPALIKFVRRAVRREPGLTFEQVLERWRVQTGTAAEDDAELLRTVYNEEVQYDQEVHAIRVDPPRPREANYSRVVLIALAAWIAAHLALLAALGLPAYAACRAGETTSGSLGCGINLGLTALAIGWLQPVYGVVIALVVRPRRTAVAQGIFIGIGVVTLLFTVLCFGGAFSG